MYSTLGGCLGDTAKLGPLARTDLCAWVKGLLDRLMTHLGSGSSKEDPWGSLLGEVGVGHPTSHNNFQIIWREGHNLARNIKESIYIRVNNPTLNNNIGKFNLPHIWDRVLLNIKGLNLKRQVNNNNTQFN